MLFELEKEVETEGRLERRREARVHRADISKTQQKLETLKTKLTARIREAE
jgi:hypothetical protein